jgi:hypothetical protein
MLRISTGLSAGLTLLPGRQVGHVAWASLPDAVLIAACTSWAAVSMLLLRVNCRVRVVEPRALLEVIWVMPGMALNCTSRGVATDEAMVSGLAPGNWPMTWIVGNSASGKGATGRRGKAIKPQQNQGEGQQQGGHRMIDAPGRY